MELFKKKDRIMKTADMLSAYKACGFKYRQIGEYAKWKEVFNGQVQVTLTIYQVNVNGEIGYIVSDTLERVAAPVQTDLKEIKTWLNEHGYRTMKQWYMEELNMTENDWNIWNGNGEETDI